MKLSELSTQYAEEAQALQGRIRTLRQAQRQSEDEETRRRLQRRIAALRPLLRQCRQLRQLTAHYYERNFYRDEHYTL